jgi:hypothetical protein
MADEPSESFAFIDTMRKKLTRAANLQRCLDRIRTNVVIEPGTNLQVSVTVNGQSLGFVDNADALEILRLADRLATKRIDMDLQTISKDILTDWSDFDAEEDDDGRALERQEVRRSNVE